MKRSEMVEIIYYAQISYENGESNKGYQADYILEVIEEAGMLPPEDHLWDKEEEDDE